MALKHRVAKNGTCIVFFEFMFQSTKHKAKHVCIIKEQK